MARKRLEVKTFSLDKFLGRNKNVIQTISLIASVGVLMLMYFNLKEIQVQRLDMYRPDIVIKDTSFSWYRNNNGSFLIPNVIITSELSSSIEKLEQFYDKIKNSPLVNGFVIKMINFGNYPAKDLMYEFDFDVESAIKTINHYDYNDTFDIEHNSTKTLIYIKEAGVVKNKIEYIPNKDIVVDRNTYSTNYRVGADQLLSFLPEYSREGDFHQLKIPEIYLYLNSIYLYLLEQIERKDPNDVVYKKNVIYKLFPVNLIISYNDFYDNIYKKFFIFDALFYGPLLNDDFYGLKLICKGKIAVLPFKDTIFVDRKNVVEKIVDKM